MDPLHLLALAALSLSSSGSTISRWAGTGRWRACGPSPTPALGCLTSSQGPRRGDSSAPSSPRHKVLHPRTWAGRGGAQIAHETTSHTQLLALSSSEMKQETQLLGCTELSAPRAWSQALGSERTRFCHHRRLLDAALEATMKGNESPEPAP